MDLAKRNNLMKTFIKSQFNNCPLIWIFHSKQLNNQINKTHERALRLVYKDHKDIFNDLFELSYSVRYLQKKYSKSKTV